MPTGTLSLRERRVPVGGEPQPGGGAMLVPPVAAPLPVGTDAAGAGAELAPGAGITGTVVVAGAGGGGGGVFSGLLTGAGAGGRFAGGAGGV